MADKSYREIRAARADQFVDFLKAEAGRARDDIRQKVVEEAWSGQKQTPRVHDHQEPFSHYLGRRDYSVDIQGNRPDSVPRPEASYERANREHLEKETGIERPPARDSGPGTRSHDERENTARAAGHIDRNVTQGDSTAREIDAQLSWENSFYERRPDGEVAIDNTAGVGLGKDEGRSYSGFMDQTYGIEPASYGAGDRDRTQQQEQSIDP